MSLIQNSTIALDIGGVCIQLRHREMFEYFGWPDGPPPGVMEMSDRLEIGEIDAADWLREFHTYTDRRFSDEEIIHGWNIVIGPAMDGMPELLGELKKQGFKLVFFSDTSTIHVAQIYRDPVMASLIDAAVYSYEAGTKKPGRKMFETFEQRHGKPAFYIDDKVENIDGGLLYGWRSHRFTDVADLRRIIEKKPIVE